MWYNILSPVYRAASNRMCQQCKPFIERDSRMLDLGCGSGLVSKEFSEFFESEVVGVDVVDRRVVPVPFKKISGNILPFSDKVFDYVLIAYVLHHCQDPVSVLKEAKRVVNGKILVYEDLPEGLLSSFFCKLHALSFDNLFHNKEKTTFKTEKEWETVFRDLGLGLVSKKDVSLPLEPVRKKLFVLSNKGM